HHERERSARGREREPDEGGAERQVARELPEGARAGERVLEAEALAGAEEGPELHFGREERRRDEGVRDVRRHVRDERVEPEPEADDDDHREVAAEDGLAAHEEADGHGRGPAGRGEPAPAQLVEGAAQLFAEERETGHWGLRPRTPRALKPS